MRRYLSVLLGLGVLALAISGCGGSSAEKDAKGDIKIGFVSPLSGDAAMYGQMAKRSIDLAVEEINSKGGIGGRKIVVNFSDDAGDPKQAAAAAQKFADDKEVMALIPSALSSNTLALAPIIDRAHLSTVAYSSSAPSLSGVSPYFFRVCGTDAQYGVVMAQWAKQTKGFQKAAVVFVNNDYGKLLKDNFIEEAKRLGLEVVGTWAYLASDRDFQAILTEVQSKNPDVIALCSTYTDAGLLVKQAGSLGIKAAFVGPGGLNTTKFVELAGSAAEGATIFTVFVADNPRPAIQEFIKKFRAKYNMAPDQPAAIAYDVIYVIADAMSRAQSSNKFTREGIQEALKSTAFEGINGKITFNEKGEWVRPYPHMTIKDGKFVTAK